MCTRTQEKGAVTPEKTEPDLPVIVQKSLAEMWVDSGLTQCQGHWIQQSQEPQLTGISHLEGGQHYCHYPCHSLASGQTTGREHSPTHPQKIGLKIYWIWPHPPEQDPDSPTVSPSHQEASRSLFFSHRSLLSLFVRGQTEWKAQSQKTNQTDPWITALSNSMQLWAMPYRATQDGWVMVESSDKM